MVQPRIRRSITPEEYLATERRAETRSEYLNGEMWAMAGASLRHNIIAGNLSAEVHQQLKGRPCAVCQSDQRVHVPATGLYTYPDIVVVCGDPILQDEHLDTLLNPTLICEVLSPNTESYDRGEKFDHYRTIESLREYVLVAQGEARVERFFRQEGQWIFHAVSGLEGTLTLASVRCEVALKDVYDRVTFDN